jgi:RNA polymerase subunit RPABC4/transcription elongation factor Spt4
MGKYWIRWDQSYLNGEEPVMKYEIDNLDLLDELIEYIEEYGQLGDDTTTLSFQSDYNHWINGTTYIFHIGNTTDIPASCPVCLDENITNTHSGQCGHKLCKECYLRITSTTNSCPMCRGQILEMYGGYSEIVDADSINPLRIEIRD